MRKITLGSLMMIVLLSSGVAFAKKQSETKHAPVTVTTQSYQQLPKRTKKGKIIRDKKGKPILEWVKATKVVPGTVVKYTDTITNHTRETLQGLALKNPINPHLTYIADSAKCETNATILYSVDGGKHFDTPDKLYITGLDKKKHLAQPREYNAIQWTIARVPPESNVTVEFKAKLK